MRVFQLNFKDGNKEWTVRGDPDYGLPRAEDVEVYVVLMELTREQGFPAQVQFSRADVLRRVGWQSNGQNYTRFLLALDRLVSVTIRTKNAFYDAQQKVWERKKAFHILDGYDLLEKRDPEAVDTGGQSWIRWSPELYANIAAGHIKALNVELFLNLRPYTAQALYRYLDAKRGGDGKTTYRIGIKKLAWEHLGLSRNYYPSQIKRELDKAHRALTACGFLSGWEYAAMRDGDEMVVYRFPTVTALPTPAANAPDPVADLVRRLHENGISHKHARALAQQRPEECERQLEWLVYREARDPGAVLYKAICDGWAAPLEWTRRQRQLKKQASRETSSSPQSLGGLEEWLEGLGKGRLELEAQAREELLAQGATFRALFAKNPDSAAIQGMIRGILRKRYEEDKGKTGPARTGVAPERARVGKTHSLSPAATSASSRTPTGSFRTGNRAGRWAAKPACSDRSRTRPPTRSPRATSIRVGTQRRRSPRGPVPEREPNRQEVEAASEGVACLRHGYRVAPPE